MAWLWHRGTGYLACWLAALAGAAPVLAQSWPQPITPEGARVQVVANDMVLNGLATRVWRFDTTGTEAQLLAFYRKQFGERRVEKTVQGQQVIAALQGEHFHTVQIKPAQSGQVQATVMINPMYGNAGAPGQPPGNRSVVMQDTERMLPPEAAVLTRMQSDDGGKRAVMVLAAHGGSTQALRDHLLNSLESRGFHVVRNDSGQVQGRASSSVMLNSPTEEVQLTISDAGRYRTVVINRVKESR